MTVESGLDDAPVPDAPHRAGGPDTRRSGMSIVLFAGLASMGAGAVHAAAAGIHAEHRELAQIFIVTAVLQLGVGLWAALRKTRLAAWAVVFVNVGAVIGWLYTRLGGISWIEGLEVREAPRFADTACAALAVVAVVAGYTGAILPAERRQRRGLLAPAALIGMFAVWTMFAAGTEVHSHDATAEAADGHAHAAAADTAHSAEAAAADAGAADGAAATDSADGHAHTADEATTEVADAHSHTTAATTQPAAEPAALAWPRAWDPTQPIDLSGVEGVTIEQEVRAVELVEQTLVDLQQFADPAAAVAAGYSSIGDAGTGSEHFIKGSLIEDDDLLNPAAPESLVYSVVDGKRTLAGAMFIASARPADDPSLTEWAGPLMTWHKHDNLCWSRGTDGVAKVVGIIDANGNCTNGVRAGGQNPMVHVWVTPHPCGVFAALEGIGAGTAAVPEAERVDMCSAEHGHGGEATDTDAAATHEHSTVAAKPYDPSLPIDLSGTPGVTPQQQAAAENLIAVTLVGLPQWSDYRTAEAAGFQSIGDSATGHEHFVQWDWIDDDVLLDPDFPESLVYEPQPDGSKKLVSAMYMAPTTVALEDVPNLGGALTQWHIHNNLCYSGYPEHPRVSGVTTSNGACPAGLVNPPPAPMIHVWIVPQECGPFAALEGVGAGQVAAGQEKLCDTAHGSG